MAFRTFSYLRTNERNPTYLWISVKPRQWNDSTILNVSISDFSPDYISTYLHSTSYVRRRIFHHSMTLYCNTDWPLSTYLLTFTYSKDSIIRPGLINFKPFENGLSTVLIIESFEIFLNSIYNRDSNYNFSSSKSWLSTVLIKDFKTIILKYG